MYFWNAKSLANELKDGSLPQSERMKYLLTTVALYAILFEISAMLAEPVTALLILQSILIVAMTIVGTLACYEVNRRGDNREFIDRYICIGWVVIIKIMVLALAVYVVYMVIGLAVGGEAFARFLDSTSIVSMMFTTIVSIVYYWRVARHIERIAN